MLFPSVGGYMFKSTQAIICFILFSDWNHNILCKGIQI